MVWYRDGVIHSIFEVENTTGISEALIRGSNVPYPCNRYLVLPEEREALIRRKLNEPAFRDRFDVDEWRIVYCTALENFWLRRARRASVTEEDFERDVTARATTDTEGTPTLFEVPGA